jgi:tRNA (mo5U34)-methyltransferase
LPTRDSNLSLSDVLASADIFAERLRTTKAQVPDIPWYPYDSMTNLPILRSLTDGMVIPTNRILDVGAADGDIAFLFADAGAEVHAIENVLPNFNKGEGLKRLNETFGNTISITFADVDFGFTLAREYDLGLAMGLVYHLRNIPLVYITLAQHCRFMITNTRVIEVSPGGLPVGAESVAYFLECREINDDPTNFWLFSPAGYRRVLKRSGWKVLRESFVGAVTGSLEADKRMWAVCERVPNYADLRRHHDF